MPRRILVADRDPEYAAALSQRIRQHCPGFPVAAAADEPAYREQLSCSSDPLSLVVSEGQFPVDDLPASVTQLILLDSRVVEPGDLQKPARPTRLGPVQPILSRLDLAMSLDFAAAQVQQQSAAQEGLCLSDCESGFPAPSGSPAANTSVHSAAAPLTAASTAAPIMDTGMHMAASAGDDGMHMAAPAGGGSTQPAGEPAAASSGRIILMLTQTTGGRQAGYADRRCLELGQAGERICYLPLQPNYFCRLAPPSGPGSGSTLTDLLLRLAGGGPEPADPGAYMAVDTMGRLHVRPADRADDLLDCRPHDLFQLVRIMRERVLSMPGTRLVIEAAGIPFRSIQAILPLCDTIEVIMPADSGYAGQALRRELGDILSGLPASVRLIQVPEQPGSRSPNHPDTASRPAAGTLENNRIVTSDSSRIVTPGDDRMAASGSENR